VGDPARTLTDADLDAIAERVAARLGARPAPKPVEDAPDPKPTAADIEEMAARMRRGKSRRR
jgi:hypothetical protein